MQTPEWRSGRDCNTQSKVRVEVKINWKKNVSDFPLKTSNGVNAVSMLCPCMCVCKGKSFV